MQFSHAGLHANNRLGCLPLVDVHLLVHATDYIVNHRSLNGTEITSYIFMNCVAYILSCPMDALGVLYCTSYMLYVYG